MIRVSASFIFVFVCFASYTQSVEIKRFYDNERKFIKESFYVKSEKSRILHGPFKSFYFNGNLKSKGNYSNNIPEGYWEYFYENGKLKNAGNLVKNKQNGHWKYFFENGNLHMEGEMADGIRKGEWKFYYESGGLKMQGYLEGEEKAGSWRYLYEDGKIKANAVYKNDKGHYKEYFSSGKIKMEGLIVSGKSDSLWRYYHENGSLQAEGFEKDGLKTGEWKFFHENGSVASQGNFEKGETNGLWKYFYPSGKLSSEGLEKEGKKEGYWKLYFEDSTLKGEGRYEKGDGEFKEYYESGKLKAVGYLKNGKNEGEWVYYYETGEVEAKCNFVDGEGYYTGFYEDGKMKMEGTLKDNKKVGVWKLYDQKGSLAGYYKTFYNNEGQQFERLPDQGQSDSVIVHEKPDIKIKKKKSRYFTSRHNEFKGYIVSTNPAAMIIGSIPLAVEYYIQERLGFEFIYSWERDPFFVSSQNIPFNEVYHRGYSTAFRMKFYKPDQALGMFYIANELRFTSTNHLANILDSATVGTPISTSIEGREKRIEYSFMVGNRFMKYADKSGFSLDFFAGLGIGYRIYTEKYPETNSNKSVFSEVNKKPASFPIRFGFTLGYAF